MADQSSESKKEKEESTSFSSLESMISLWRKASAVCFDVDSTVSVHEGIDLLAETCGKSKEVKELTNQAMHGKMLFEDALAQRLELMKPSKAQVLQCLHDHPIQLTPGVSALITKLHALDKKVFLISGGFTEMVYPIADQLGIPHSHVFANVLLFHDEDSIMNNTNSSQKEKDENEKEGGNQEEKGKGKEEKLEVGDYRGYDKESFTAKSGGKAKVIQFLKDKYFAPLPEAEEVTHAPFCCWDSAKVKTNKKKAILKTDEKKEEEGGGVGGPVIIVIGDGVTDMQAKPPADGFIGYGGVVVREEVQQGADWFITAFEPLMDALGSMDPQPTDL